MMSDAELTNTELLQDFVSESTELIEAVDQDLVALEQAPDDRGLLDQIFRALHTIKGSSSFLGLDALTAFAHAAEDALNALRKGAVRADAACMDALLRAADVVRTQIAAVAAGDAPPAGPEDLIALLQSIANEPGEPGEAARDGRPGAAGEPAGPDQPLQLPESKLELLPFMVDDLKSNLQKVSQQLAEYDPGSAASIADAVDELIRSSEFFEVSTIVEELTALHDALMAVHEHESRAVRVVPEAERLIALLQRRVDALSERRLLNVDATEVRDALDRAAAGHPVADAAAVAATSAAAPAGRPGPDDANNAARGERTIRVDVDRLETLLNLVGELVLQKNRVAALGRRVESLRIDSELADELDQAGSDLDRVTADLQMSVMKTRMQPLSKLFSRYPRMVRDLARATGKQLRLEVEGGETEVDKSVLEGLGDPLVHILRNSGDHGIEPTDERVAAGKDACGTVRIAAWHEGSHVIVEISDDGRGLDPGKIAASAQAKGMVTAEQLQGMSDRDILSLIFKPGFSTAHNVSNISGRGVGMDVVRSNIVRMNGLVDVRSEPGAGTTVTIRIPLTVAIMPAMMVRVGAAMYALPLPNVVEIFRPEMGQVRHIGGRPSMRVRDRVLPVLNLSVLFGVPEADRSAPVAVVLALGERRVVLLVDGLVGQQEIVIKPIDECVGQGGLVGGATVRDDGGVSLILDVPAIFETVTHTAPVAA